jgi:hypothetical protein
VVAINLSISRAWDETRAIFGRDGGLLTSVALAMIVLPEVIAGIVAPQTPGAGSPSGAVQLLRLAAVLISFVGQLSIVRLALGPSTTVGSAIGHGARRFPSALGAVLLLMLGLVIFLIPVMFVLGSVLGVNVLKMSGQQPNGAAGLLVLVVTLIVLAVSVRFTLVTPVASAEPIGPIRIIRRSWDLTAGNFWRLLGFILLLLIATLALLFAAGIVGGLLARLVSPQIEPFSVGALIVALVGGLAQGAFSILTAVMLARIYAQAAGRDAQVSVPSSGT